MKPLDYFLSGSFVGMLLVLILVATNPPKPVYVPQKVQCNDIIRYEDGSLVCEIDLKAEDDAIGVQQI